MFRFGLSLHILKTYLQCKVVSAAAGLYESVCGYEPEVKDILHAVYDVYYYYDELLLYSEAEILNKGVN